MTETVRVLQAELAEELESVEKQQSYSDALRLKTELQTRLQQLQGSIDTLKNEDFDGFTRMKINKLDKEGRKRYKEEEEKKREETTEFARRLREAQKERIQKQKAELDTLQRKIDLDKEEEARKTIEKVELLKAEKQTRLKNIQEKAKKRREYLLNMRKHAEEVIPPLKPRPILSEPQNSSFPPSETRSKSPKIKPVKTKPDFPIQGMPSPKRYEMSPFLKKAMKQEEENRALQLKAAADRKRRAEKTKRYAEIVKEMFAPAVDIMKQKELELIKQKLTNPVVKRIRAEDRDTRSWDESQTGTVFGSGESVGTRRKRTVKRQQTNSPVVSPKKKGEAIDYLARMHSERLSEAQRLLKREPGSNDGHLSELSYKSVEDKAHAHGEVRRLERLVHEKERVLRHLDPVSMESMEVEAGMNSLIVSSVKAKLAMLGQLT